MYQAAEAYKRTSMLTEEPSLSWIIRGLRGVRTYVAAASRAATNGDVQTRAEAVSRASGLLAFLQGLTPDNDASPLGQRLGQVYTGFQLRLTEAHAASREDLFVALNRDIARLETDLGAAGTLPGTPA